MAIDYTKFGPNGPISSQVNATMKWWKVSKDERASAVTAAVKFISEYDSKRQTQYQISNRLYGNSSLMGMNGLSYSKVQSVNGTLKDRLTYNVCESVVDTITSKMCKNKPRPMFLTSGGDYKLQRKAKKLEKFVEGIFYENKIAKFSRTIFRDAAISGDGIAHVFIKNGRIKYERVLASELYVDWVDGFYGEPRQIHRVKNIDRDVLIDLFPNKKSLIQNANSASAEMVGVVQNIADQITVYESWHLPSGEGAGDGIHTINIPEGNLFDEKYTHNRFPFAILPWSKRVYGFWGQGAIERIQNIQLEINKILWVIQRSFHLAGSFKILMENGSKIVKETLNNDIGAIVTYTGAEPKYIVPPIVPLEMYAQVQNLKNQAFESAGISQLSAAAKKPAGLDSGKALREFNDIESDRFISIGQAYEEFHLDLADLTIMVAKDLYEEQGSVVATYQSSKFIEEIDWKDIDLSEDQYVLKMYPVSSLPNEPSGRLQTIQEYMQAGFLNQRTGRKLLDFPDLEAQESLANSTEEYLNQILEKIMEEGILTSPEPFDDLVLARELALEYYTVGKMNGLEEEKLELFRSFISQLDVLEQKAAEEIAMQQMQQAPMASPSAVPEAPPVSDLIPNAPGALPV